MAKLIVLEEEYKYKFNNIEELVKKIMGEDYYNLDNIQKQNKIKFLTRLNMINNKLPAIVYDEYKNNFEEKAYIINDEITYILSLLRLNKFSLFEEKGANIFAKYIDNVVYENDYVLINNYANEIMKKYLNTL